MVKCCLPARLNIFANNLFINRRVFWIPIPNSGCCLKNFLKKMKYTIIRSESRGAANHGWLKSRFSFSFAAYYDPERIHFGMLRVLNDDIIAGGQGFGMHPHDNMEIVSIPLFGALEHRDSMGNGSVIRPGEIQLMHAGTGIRHSEFNPLEEEGGFLQIWIFPEKHNTKPGYAQKAFDTNAMKNKLLNIVSPNGENDSLTIGQQAWLSMGVFEKGQMIDYKTHRPENGMYLFMIEGEASWNNETLKKRDALAISETNHICLNANDTLQLLVIEIPMQ